MKQNQILGGLFGLSIGDALGVPVEFIPREERIKDPVTDMRGFGTHNQPPGTWSDDSSLAFCLCESLCTGYDLNDIGKRFVDWYDTGYWSAHGNVFDIGIGTRKAIQNLKGGMEPIKAGPRDEYSNGNGSLMRILPLAFYVEKEDITTQFNRAHEVSCLTHGHIRSQMACGIYTQIAVNLIGGMDKERSYERMIDVVSEFYSSEPYIKEIQHFKNILEKDFSEFSSDEISASGYVIKTLEASLWCLLKNDSYEKTVLAAVNLGEDTDTVGAIAGGLAGIHYGYKGIPKRWIESIARKDEIYQLGKRLYQSLSNK